jgi:hypothetical protein
MGLKNDTKETTNEALGLSMYSNSESTSIVLMTGIGPIQQYVLADIYAWLEAHSGFTSPAAAARIPTSSIPSSNSTSK